MRKYLTLIILWAITGILFARGSVDYEVSFANADHHEAEITATFSGIPHETLEVRISRSSPGYYALFEFTKNIYNVKAYDSEGLPVSISKPNPHQWNVTGHDGEVTMTYTLFADHMDGTHSSIESRHVYLNIPSAFIWARGLENYPITVKINNPHDSKQILTQLKETETPGLYTAPDLDYFIDSPIEIAPFAIREWNVGEAEEAQTIKLAVHDNRFFMNKEPQEENNDDVEIYARMAEVVLHEQIAVFGELPTFDYGSFTIMSNHLKKASYDGMEHRNSTVLTTSLILKNSFIKILQLLSHELIHLWNGERLRPASLMDFNLEKTNTSGELWFLEGFTSYLQDLVIYRSGLISLDNYGVLLNKRVNFVLNMPGHRLHSPVEMSRMAPLFNGGIYLDSNNRNNIYISYYYYGAVTALSLDLMLRRDFDDIGLDDYLKLIWNEFGKAEKPYTNKDLELLLIKLTKDIKFGESFFKNHVYGNKIAPLKTLLGQAGFLLNNVNPGKASLGDMNFIRDVNGEVGIGSRILYNEPIYHSGIDLHDVLLELDNKPIKSKKELEALLSHYKPGDTLSIGFRKPGGEIRESEVTLAEDGDLEIVPFETAGLEVTREIEQFRDAWLGARSSVNIKGVVKRVPGARRKYPLTYDYCPYTGEKLKIVLEESGDFVQ